MSDTPQTERHEFQSETKRLLELVIHSLYSHRDIFLRELVSNASDALDKRRVGALTDESLQPAGELEIRLEIDADARTVTVQDNGIGMSREELISNIGTIARSGTKEFAELLKTNKELAERPELIGQFGVGFYSSFLVADRVELVSRKAGTDTAVRWESEGAGSFTVADAERADAGTSVTLHLKPVDEDEGIADYTSGAALEAIVRRYSDFVSYPIKLASKEGDDRTLNSMKAIWTRPAADVTDEERNEFYKHVSHDWTDPLAHVSTKIEGTFEARALLFVPTRAPFDLYRPDASRRGVHLYVKRVFIMDDCTDLLPNWLRFVSGVVDSEDLPLNVSREVLQTNRQVRAIRKHLVKKVVDELLAMKRERPEKYLEFWAQFGAVIKEGLLPNNEQDNRVLDLLVTPSSGDESGGLVSLSEYCDRMSEGQEAIYYLTCASSEVGRKSPHLERLRERGIEVLLLSDHVDELWLQDHPTFQDKSFRSVLEADVELGEPKPADDDAAADEREAASGELGELLPRLRAALQEQVKEVRSSKRLTSSPACLVGDKGDVTPQMARLMRSTGMEVPKLKRILEVNPEHAVVQRMAAMAADAGASQLDEYARVLYGLAVLAEGGELEEPSDFARRVADLLV